MDSDTSFSTVTYTYAELFPKHSDELLESDLTPETRKGIVQKIQAPQGITLGEMLRTLNTTESGKKTSDIMEFISNAALEHSFEKWKKSLIPLRKKLGLLDVEKDGEPLREKNVTRALHNSVRKALNDELGRKFNQEEKYEITDSYLAAIEQLDVAPTDITKFTDKGREFDRNTTDSYILELADSKKIPGAAEYVRRGNAVQKYAYLGISPNAANILEGLYKQGAKTGLIGSRLDDIAGDLLEEKKEITWQGTVKLPLTSEERNEIKKRDIKMKNFVKKENEWDKEKESQPARLESISYTSGFFKNNNQGIALIEESKNEGNESHSLNKEIENNRDAPSTSNKPSPITQENTTIQGDENSNIVNTNNYNNMNISNFTSNPENEVQEQPRGSKAKQMKEVLGSLFRCCVPSVRGNGNHR